MTKEELAVIVDEYNKTIPKDEFLLFINSSLEENYLALNLNCETTEDLICNIITFAIENTDYRDCIIEAAARMVASGLTNCETEKEMAELIINAEKERTRFVN